MSFTSNCHTRDSGIISYSPPEPQHHPLLTMIAFDLLISTTSLQAQHLSPSLRYWTMTPGIQTTGWSTNQPVGSRTLNQKNHLKSIGRTSDMLASTSNNPFHPQIYLSEQRVEIELIGYSCQGLLQEHPAAHNPPTPFLWTPSPPYHPPSLSPDEGIPHRVPLTLTIQPPTLSPSRRVEAVDSESEDISNPLVPFVEPFTGTQSPQVESLHIIPDPETVQRFTETGQFNRPPLMWMDQYLVRLLLPTYEKRWNIDQQTKVIQTGCPHFYFFIFKVFWELQNPCWFYNIWSFCDHSHHLHYLTIWQDYNCLNLNHHREQWTSHCFNTPLEWLIDPCFLEQLASVMSP